MDHTDVCAVPLTAFAGLPNEVVLLIARHLDVRSLLQLGLVDRRLHLVAHVPNFLCLKLVILLPHYFH